MKVLAVIPARAGSKSVPGKNLKEFMGQPLLRRAIALCKAVGMDTVVVSSEDEETLNLAAEWGAIALKRPEELARDSTPTIPVLKHAYEHFPEHDVIACVQCTAPMATPEDWLDGFQMMENADSDYLLSVYPWTKPIITGKERFKNEITFVARQEKEPRYMIDGQIWACRPRFLDLKPTDPVNVSLLISTEFRVDIDYEEDFVIGEALVKWRENQS